VVVIRFSAASGDVWAQMASGMNVELRTVAPGDGLGVPNAAAVILAAGGAEREAMAWLEGRAIPREVPVFAVGLDQSRRIAAQLVHRGARDYFALPDDIELLHNELAAAVERRQEAVRRHVRGETNADAAFQQMIGDDGAFRAVLERAALVAPYPRATSLILGEEGTGKEMLARAIHHASGRRGAPFVPVNCSTLPSHAIEAELFGVDEAGGAGSKPGLFEVADGGTIYLDQVGALPTDVQAKLLRVLEDWEVTRMGSTRPRPVDLRVIAASSDDLDAAVRRGAFRRDLRMRLGVVVLTLPPLRERGSDVWLVAEELLTRLSTRHELPAPELSAEARRAIREHTWPGNVQDLKHSLERALLLSAPGQLSVSELFAAQPERQSPPGGLPFPAELDDITSAAAAAMLDMCDHNVSEAARRLNISRSRLRRLLKLSPATLLARATA
jgi:DNA-binding NtrC family response regulator